jgi:1-pyrroline-5-carboxylate dehydrogenase
MGDTRDFRNFMSAVIDKKAFTKIGRLHRRTRSGTRRSSRAAAANGACEGYFIEPTLVQTDNPGYKLLCEEIFGPVLTRPRLRRLEVHRDAGGGRQDVALRAHRLDLRERPRRRCVRRSAALRNAAGNFYINDKPTGATWASSRSAARAPRAPTTRPARS